MKPAALPIGFVLAGLLLAAMNWGAPRMTSDHWDSSIPDGDSAAYYRSYDENVNSAALRLDFGIGLASLGTSLLVLLAAMRCWTPAQVAALMTPRSRWRIFLSANIAWVCFIGSSAHFLGVQQQRGEFPPWADSIGIPLMGLGAILVLGLVVVNAGLALCLHRAHLPTSLWTRPEGLRATVLTGIVAALLFGCALALYQTVVAGDVLSIPAIVAIAWLLLIGRAASAA